MSTLEDAVNELVAQGLQEQAQHAYWRAIVAHMEHDHRGLESAIAAYREDVIFILGQEGDDDETRADVLEEFDRTAIWMRRKVQQARELVELADLKCAANKGS